MVIYSHFHGDLFFNGEFYGDVYGDFIVISYGDLMVICSNFHGDL